MPESNYIEGKAETWNVAAANAYSIFTSTDKCEILINMCKFGSVEFGDNLDITVLNRNKKEALERLLEEMKSIIRKSCGFINKTGRTKQGKVKDGIEKIKNVLILPNGNSAILRNEVDVRNRTQTYKLIEPHFSNCLEKTEEMYDELIISIKGILGRITDEIDLDTLKKQIIEGG